MNRHEGHRLSVGSWLTAADDDGQPRHELYGLASRTAKRVRIGCFYQDPDDLPWAQHVWRSITHHQAAPVS